MNESRAAAMKHHGISRIITRSEILLPAHISLLHVVGAIAFALLVRLPFLFKPLQIDEYPVVYAIASRATASPGLLPAETDPLIRVDSAEIVRERSVLPYGIEHPWPLFNYIEYLAIKVLPIAEWSLRMPSLLAGLATIPVIYLVCRVWAGHPVALLAALLTAVEPLQVISSTIARPYALGNFFIALTCLLLQVLLFSGGLKTRVACTGGIGLTIAFIGYLNPVLLLVVPGYFLLLAAAAFRARESRSCVPIFPVQSTIVLTIALAISALLLFPLREYFLHLRENFLYNTAYLGSDWIFLGAVPRLGFFLEHNASLIAGVFLLTMFRHNEGGASSLSASSASEQPEIAAVEISPFTGWLTFSGMVFAATPQILVLVQYAMGGQGAFLSRYLCYTSLGGILVLSSLWGRVHRRCTPGSMAVLLVVALLLLCFHQQGRGFNLDTGSPFLRQSVRLLDDLLDSGLWREGDVILYQPYFLEADLLPEAIPERRRQEVSMAMLSPLTTLYASKHKLPVVILSMSIYRGLNEVRAGRSYQLRNQFYNKDLAAHLRTYRRFWLLTPPWDRTDYIAFLLPWLADALGKDLQATEVRPAVKCNITANILVPRGLAEDQDLMDLKATLGRHTNALVLLEPSHNIF